MKGIKICNGSNIKGTGAEELGKTLLLFPIKNLQWSMKKNPDEEHPSRVNKNL